MDMRLGGIEVLQQMKSGRRLHRALQLRRREWWNWGAPGQLAIDEAVIGRGSTVNVLIAGSQKEPHHLC